MTDLNCGDVKVAVTATGIEVTAKITAAQPAEYRLRFEVETADGSTIRLPDGEVAARFYLADQLMYFTVQMPESVRGANTLNVYADGRLEASKPFAVPAP